MKDKTKPLVGLGSRLVRTEKDDWLNVRVEEGKKGWAAAYVFTRTYCYQPGRTVDGHYIKAGHLYRFDATRKQGLALVASAHGQYEDEARQQLLRELERMGLKPVSPPTRERHSSGLGYVCPVCDGDEGTATPGGDWDPCDKCDGLGYVS